MVQDKHATQVLYTAGNHSINMAAEYICVCVFLNLVTLFYAFSKNISLLLLKIYEVVAIFKCLNTLKGRALVFAFLV